MVNLGVHENLPVLTFTSVLSNLQFVPPAEAYLRTIALGLMECWHGELSKDELVEYLGSSRTMVARGCGGVVCLTSVVRVDASTIRRKNTSTIWNSESPILDGN